MKKTLIVGALALAVSGSLCFGQGLSTTTGNPEVVIPPKPSPAGANHSDRARGGVVFTAVRNGNPLQMLNPAAPAAMAMRRST